MQAIDIGINDLFIALAFEFRFLLFLRGEGHFFPTRSDYGNAGTKRHQLTFDANTIQVTIGHQFGLGKYLATTSQQQQDNYKVS